MRRVLLAMLLMPAGIAAASDDASDTDTARPDLSAPETKPPWRSVYTPDGAHAQGARQPPPAPPRVFVGPKWLQRTLNVPDTPTPDERRRQAEAASRVPTSDVQDAEITARNIPPEPPRPSPITDYEIVVWGDRLEEARARVTERLTDLGYTSKRTRNGRTVWEPTGANDSWKPRVILDDDGWFELKSPTVSGTRMNLDNAAMQPGPTNYEGPALDYQPPMAAPGIGGQISGKRVRMHAEARLTRQIWDVVRDLGLAHEDMALIDRLESLPDELDALWYEGVGPDGEWYATTEERQEKLLWLWSSRTRTRAGETVRRKIGDYLIAVVDAEARLDSLMVEQAERECGCALFGS